MLHHDNVFVQYKLGSPWEVMSHNGLIFGRLVRELKSRINKSETSGCPKDAKHECIAFWEWYKTYLEERILSLDSKKDIFKYCQAMVDDLFSDEHN